MMWKTEMKSQLVMDALSRESSLEVSIEMDLG